MQTKLVDRRHFVCGTVFDLRLDARVRRFWQTRHLDLVHADGAVLVTKGDEIVAFLRYLVGRYSAFRAIFGLGTYVLPEYRNRGLAQHMWHKAICETRAEFANIYLTSRASSKLLDALQRRHPKVVFYHCRDYA